jgi:phenylacetate-CoA ligase
VLRDVWPYYRFYRKEVDTPRWSRATALSQQRAALSRTIRRACRNVPFYRDHFDRAGVRPEEIRTAEDLWRIPPVSRDELREAGDERILDRSERRQEFLAIRTSGSVGKPFNLRSTRQEALNISMIIWSGLYWTGMRLRDRILTMMAAPLLPIGRPFNVRHCPPTTPVDERLELFERFAPTAIAGQTIVVAGLARDLVTRGLHRGHRVRRVTISGQILTDEIKALIREGFGVEPVDIYGTMETLWSGVMCRRQDGYHVPMHRLIVQIGRIERPGSPSAPDVPGELILTDLNRATQPLIRYRIGDVGCLRDTPCPCGWETPRLFELQGRVLDFLLSREGRHVAPTEIGLASMQQSGDFLEFRVIQHSREDVEVLLVPGSAFHAGIVEEVRARIRSKLGDVAVRVRKVDEIPPEPSGKRRRYIRLCSLDAPSNR